MKERRQTVSSDQLCPDDATAADVLALALRRHDDITSPRTLEQHVVGQCFHSAVLYCALFRAHQIPARARCGFARYLIPGMWTCHWIVERWDGRWVQDDPDVNRADMEAGGFQTGVEAWRACRAGDDPERYGFPGATGWLEVQGSVVCDLAALAKDEQFEYSAWPLAAPPAVNEEERRWLDSAAAAGAADDLAAVMRAATGNFHRLTTRG